MSIFSRSYQRQIKQYDKAGLGKGGWIIWLLCWSFLLTVLLLNQSHYATSTWIGLVGSLRSTVSFWPNALSWVSPYSFALLVTSFFCLWGLWQLALQSMRIQLLLAQMALLLLIPISPIRGLYRSLTRRVRHDLLLTRLSPLHNPVYLWNALPIALAEFMRKNNIRIQFIAIILFGGIGIPGCQYIVEYGFRLPVIEGQPDTVKVDPEPTQPGPALNIDPSAGSTEPNGTAVTPELSTPSSLTITRTETISFLKLMALGVISTLVLLALWACVRFVLVRQRHLVLHFEVPDNDKALTSIATILTHKFVAHLQQIGFLLSRQVENVNIRLENPLSLFVTSGQEEELIRQLSDLSDFEVSNVRLPVGRLLSIAVIGLADTRVRGTVQRTHNGAIEAWVEFYSRKAKRSFEIERITIPNPTEELLSDAILEDMARELAVRLAYQLGHTYNLASSWESLKWFLAGLEASSKRNWWYAIANYKRATEIEETVRSSFGTGHYHIGATLLSQGEPHAALEHLQRAEASGPPSPETHYMLALTYLALNYENLDGTRDRKRQSAPTANRKSPDDTHKHKQRALNRPSLPTHNPSLMPSDIIVHHLQAAIRLVKNFSEAYHLLGIIHYQLARVAERAKEKTSPSPAVNYLYSAHYFRYAIRSYRKNLQQLRQRSSYLPTTEKERIRIVQDEMIATHHLADALRSLGLHQEAVEYYRDVQMAFPGRVRNLVDQAMTYCQWEKWSMAEGFIAHEMGQRAYAIWTADTQLYWAWAAAGSVNKTGFWQSLQEQGSAAERTQTILHALTRLDMALFLRPRFIFRREQTDWMQVWRPIAELIDLSPELLAQVNSSSTEENSTISYQSIAQQCEIKKLLAMYKADFDKSEICYSCLSHQVSLWIAWRIYTYLDDKLYSAYIDKYEHQRSNLSMLLAFDIPELYPDFYNGYSAFQQVVKTLRHHRHAVAELLFVSDQKRLLMSPDIIWERVKLCKAVYDRWKFVHEIWAEIYSGYKKEIADSKDRDKAQGIHFAKRWQIDIYVQVATFTCRLLAHSQDYQHLLATAATAMDYVDLWINLWGETYGNSFRFSPNLLRYHYVTIFTWKAYAELMIETQSGQKADIRKLLEGIDALQGTAQNFRHTQHPLFLYVRAKYYQLAELHREAINDFVALLHVIEPFDSRSFNPFDFALTLVREDLKQESKELTSEDVRTQLFYLERVSGQQQFDFLVNNAQIYRDLALSLQKIGETRSSVDYLLRGLTWSPYKDFDMDNFVRLATSLLELDMFHEALAVVEEAKSRIGNYSQKSLRTSTLITLYVLECILRSRLENYGEALELGIRLAEQTPFILETLENLPEAGNPTLPVNNPFQDMLDHFDHIDPVNPTTFITGFVEEPKTLEWRKLAHFFDQLLRHVSVSGLPNKLHELRPAVASAEWLDLSREYLNPTQLEASLKQWDKQNYREHTFYYEWHMLREIRLLAAKGSCLLLIQACELYNNIAYNLAKLGMAPNSALRYNTVAISVMNALIQCLPTVGSAHKPNLVQQDKAAQPAVGPESNTTGNPEMATLFSQRLAQYYDTRAWIYFRRRRKHKHRSQSDLQTAIALLKEYALAYDQNHPVLHYHLARAYLALAEAIWQDVEKASPKIPTVAEEIRHCLTQASHHWKIANSLDKSGRLTADLRACRQRINEYAAIWRDVHAYKGLDEKES